MDYAMHSNSPVILSMLCVSYAALNLTTAAVPLRWTVETSRMSPALFDAYHGETLDLVASFESYGRVIEFPGPAALYYQTNGMGNVWWSIPATAMSNTISAVFAPAFDPGASSLNCFLGGTASTYRAFFRLRYHDSPGGTPNVLPLPPVSYNAALSGSPTINGTNLAEWVAARSQEESDPRAPGIVSNIVTKSYVEGLGISGGGGGIDTNTVLNLIEAYAPAPGNYDAVSNAAMHAADAASLNNKRDLADRVWGSRRFSEWIVQSVTWPNASLAWFADYDEAAESSWLGTQDEWIGPGWYLNYGVGPGTHRVSEDPYATEIVVWDLVFSRRDITDHLSLDSETDAKVADAISSQQSQVGQLWNFLMAENFRVVVTNYDSTTHAPEASYEYRMSTNESFRVVWAETNGLMRTHRAATNDSIRAAKDEIARPENRAWGHYDSTTGLPAPDGIVQVSAEGGLMIGGGMGYTSVAAGGGEYWVLSSTDPSLCRTGTNGVFEIIDSSGNAAITVRKGDKRLVPAPVDAITVQGGNIVITYIIESADHPTIECSSTLDGGGTWYEPGSTGAPFGPATWTGQSGAWVATIPQGSHASGFLRSSYWTGGGTVVSYGGAAVDFGKIKIGNVEYTVGTATISGHSVMTLEAVP